MSRRRVSADEPGCSWEYGWDPLGQTFSAELVVTASPPETVLVRYGTQFHEIPTVEVLMYLMGVRLSDDQVATLNRDRVGDSHEVEADGDGRPGPRLCASPRPRHLGSVRVARRLTMVSDRAR